MAQTKISQLTELSSIADNDVLAGVDTSAGTTKKVKMSTLKSYINTGDAQDVQINGTSVVSGNVANIAVEGTYNASTNKLETVSDVNSKTGTLSNLTTTNKTNLVSAINELNTNKEENSNKTDTLDENSTNTQYPGAKAVYDLNSTTKEDLENELSKTQAQLDTYKTIFNALPKVSGTGENISLDGTAESPLKMDLKGNTSQVSYTGKNLLKLDLINTPSSIAGMPFTYTDNAFTLKGTATSTWGGSNLGYNLNIVSGKTYNFSANVTGTNPKMTISLYTYDSNNTQLFKLSMSSANDYNNHTTANFEGIIDHCRFVMEGLENGGSYDLVASNIQFEEGSSATDFEPYVGGNPSPNPQFPERVEVVSVDNEIEVCGKNLFDKNILRSGYRLDTAGNTTNSGASDMWTSSFIKVVANTQYTKNSPTANAYHRVCFYSSNSYTSFLSKSENNTFTTPNDCKYIRFCGYNTELDTTQLELGNQITTYIPYQFTTYPIYLGVENLFDKDNLQNGYVNSSGVFVTDNGWKTTDFIKVSSNTTYTISNATSRTLMCQYSSNVESSFVETRLDKNASTITFTTGENTKYIKISEYIYDRISDTFQLEEGSKPNSYSPYGTKPIELCKIGDYKDKFIRNNGKNLFNKSDITWSANDGIVYTPLYVGDGTFTLSSPDMPHDNVGTNMFILSGNVSSGAISSTNGVDKSTPRTVTSINGYITIANRYRYSEPQNTNHPQDYNWQLEKGTQTEYEPYGKGEWYLEKNICKVVLDGTNTKITSVGSSNNIYYGIYQKQTGFKIGTIPMSNCYKGGTPLVVKGRIYIPTNSNLVMCDTGSSLTTKELWNAWLKDKYDNDNPVIIFYVGYAPTYTKIEGTLANQLDDIANATSYPTQTNILQINNDLPFIIDAQALLDISNLENRVTLLED